MKRPHIAFLNLPAPPHINPTLSIVRSLLGRGYRVTYVTSDAYQTPISAMGAEVVNCSRLFESVQIKQSPIWPSWDEIGQAYPFFIDFATRVLPEVMGQYEHDRPDLILYDSLFFAGRVLATRWSIPAIQTSPIFAFHDVYFTRERESGKCYTPQGFVEFSRELDRFYAGHGLLTRDALFHKEQLNLHFLPRVFQFEGDSFDQSFVFAGGCIAERPSQGEWTKVAKGPEPVILVSASTSFHNTPEYFQLFIDALEPLPWSVVIATGDKILRSALRHVPDSVEIHQYLPFPKVLPHAWLNVCHGGTSTIVESLFHGVPLICISQSAEPGEYSQRVEELGVGIHIKRPELTVEVLRAAVLRMSSDSALLNKVADVRDSIRRENGGPEHVADRIESFLAGVLRSGAVSSSRLL